MARLTNRDDLAPVLAAYEKWKDTCLVEDGSLFSQGPLWTSANVEGVKRAFVDHPDLGDDDFTTKLKGQMKSASAAAKQLMAEMLWAVLLFPSNVNADTKREQVRDIWALSGQELDENLPVLGDDVLAGIGSGGPGFNNYRWRELVYLIALSGDLKRRSAAERRQFLSDYDAFQDWIATVPRQGDRQYRHMLRFFSFPDRVERMSSNGDRKAVLAAFDVAPERETKQWNDRQLDEALLKLRTRLQAENPSQVLDFYEPPLEARWLSEHRQGGSESLRAELEAVLLGYVEAIKKQPFGKRAPMYQRFDGIEALFRKSEPVRRRPNLKVVASAGQGNWGAVPWIAFLDSRETTTTQRGVYCVYLFREDMSGVYLTFNQGVTQLTKELHWRTAESKLKGLVATLRSRFPELTQQGFSVGDDIDLRAHGNLGQMYEVGTIAHKFYEAGHLPLDEDLLRDLDHVLGVYSQFADNESPATSSKNAWLFQANPTYFDLGTALHQLAEMTWVVRQHGDLIHAGDKVFVWESGEQAGVVALATVLTDTASIAQSDSEMQFDIDKERFAGVQPRVRIRIDQVLPRRLPKSALLGHPVLGKLTVLTAPQGSNFRVTPEQAQALSALLDSSRPVRKDLKAVAQEFGAALRNSHVSFGGRHEEVVRSFVASLATKRFVILTGLSGSGKTQLGLRFGEWIGEDRSRVVPVRPDWTGAEALFGYEDALREASDGRRAWQVPEPLEFMLRAAADSSHPYVLILDEMNLAHVERYFADVLSGMESDQACLPNLQREGDGSWFLSKAGPTKVPVPRNLFVVGTVNVDETTYMFSPKVLDRANTFEFRVETSDLAVGLERPVRCEAGDPALVAGFLDFARDDRWQITNPAPNLDELARLLRTVHQLLSVGGFEFGHRVFYEAVRFAAMHAAAGNPDSLHSFDLLVLQKILPKLHGSRRRLESTLCALGVFCRHLNYSAEVGLTDAAGQFDSPEGSAALAKLPRSYEKLVRMIGMLRSNQFVSFTE